MAEKWKERVAKTVSDRICPVPGCGKPYKNHVTLFGHLYSHRKADIIKALYSILNLKWNISLEELNNVEAFK